MMTFTLDKWEEDIMIFKHYRGGLYRVLLHVGSEPHRVDDRENSDPLLATNVATNDHEAAYERVNIYLGYWGGVWAHLPYDSVLYISQETLQLYLRKRDEFYGDVVTLDGKVVKRFTEVT
jgi:hypothetical protein